MAADRLGVPPQACLVVEDAPAGVEAAATAGCRVVGLTTTHPATALHQAHLHATSLSEVRHHLTAAGVPAAAHTPHGR
ncbi:HAD family phosphatase [Streptomyces sp. MUM 203J]|uniref:HAD-IA family hydrolase n=1 Tax=Streptomyces sp. MUM 203J TaxID=2791990 RepID=UPI001F03A9F8|nr:HAD family phosphatase [Streptomyces sp. MUM 203J]